jgi:hypothetical protein
MTSASSATTRKSTFAFRKAFFAWREAGSKEKDFPTILSERQLKIHGSIKQPEWDWITGLPHFISVTPQIVAVHAGLEPAIPFENQNGPKTMRLRYVNKKGIWGDHSTYFPPKGGYFWAEKWRGTQSVIYGHTTFKTPRLDTYKKEGKLVSWTLGIDTGACYGDDLTALVFKDDATAAPEVVQVTAKKVYYDRTYSKKKKK